MRSCQCAPPIWLFWGQDLRLTRMMQTGRWAAALFHSVLASLAPAKRACLSSLCRFACMHGAERGVLDLAQVLTAIELARNARKAANKAYWASLAVAGGRGRTGASLGSPALAVDHPLVMKAARDLARKAALQQATLQVALPHMIGVVAMYQFPTKGGYRCQGLRPLKPGSLQVDVADRIWRSQQSTKGGNVIVRDCDRSNRGLCRLMRQRGGGHHSTRGWTWRLHLGLRVEGCKRSKGGLCRLMRQRGDGDHSNRGWTWRLHLGFRVANAQKGVCAG